MKDSVETESSPNSVDLVETRNGNRVFGRALTKSDCKAVARFGFSLLLICSYDASLNVSQLLSARESADAFEIL